MNHALLAPLVVLLVAAGVTTALVGGGHGLRAATALVRRRFQVYWSYRWAVYATLARLGVLLGLIVFIGPLVAPFFFRGLSPRTWDGFALEDYVVIGIVAWPVFWEGYEIAARNIRTEQFTGIFEVLIPTPVGVGVLPVAYLLMTMLVSLVAAFVSLPLVLWAFDVEVTYTAGMLLTTAAVLVTALFMTWGLGLLLGGLTAIIRETGPVSTFLKLLFLALCGAYIPLQMFPDWIAAIGRALPLTWAFEALRGALSGASLLEMRTEFLALLAWSVALATTGLLVFRRLLDRARKLGTTYGY